MAVTEPFTDVAIAPPAPPLRSLIANYVGYHMRGYAPGVHRGLPGRLLTFIISLDDPVEMAALPNPRQGPTSMTAFVGGLAAAPAIIRHDGTQYGIALELTPLGARTLFGLPAGALAHEVVDLGELLGSPTNELMDRLAAAPDWRSKFAVLDEVLTRSTREAKGPPPEVVHAWQCLSATHGSIEVNELAREVGWSRRHLAQQFRTELGLTPKVLARVMRFERAKLAVKQAKNPNLADVAAACGYYDQAHMNRDWRELAGCAPTTWLAEELPHLESTPA